MGGRIADRRNGGKRPTGPAFLALVVRVFDRAATFVQAVLCAALLVMWAKSYAAPDYLCWRQGTRLALGGHSVLPAIPLPPQMLWVRTLTSHRGMIEVRTTGGVRYYRGLEPLTPPIRFDYNPVDLPYEIEVMREESDLQPNKRASIAGVTWQHVGRAFGASGDPWYPAGWDADRSLRIPYAWLVALAALGPSRAWLSRRWRSHTVRRARGRCPACGYDLRATPGRCPECGRIAGSSGE